MGVWKIFTILHIFFDLLLNIFYIKQTVHEKPPCLACSRRRAEYSGSADSKAMEAAAKAADVSPARSDPGYAYSSH